jgi:hypothetical protein
MMPLPLTDIEKPDSPSLIGARVLARGAAG